MCSNIPFPPNGTERQHILRMVAEEILRLPNTQVVRVDIDGVDGSSGGFFRDGKPLPW